MGAVAGLLNELLVDLSFRSYRANRERTPDITPQRWKQIYGDEVDAFEARYQDEINAYADAAIRREKAMPDWERKARTGARDE